MRLRTLVVAAKASVKTGEWKRGEIPRAQWPSRKAKSKAYKYGPLYQWRIIGFDAAGYSCRVRLLLNEHKQIFRATLGVVLDAQIVVLCDYEFHSAEPGWHCHARCGDVQTIDGGTNRFGAQRLPAAGSRHRRMEFRFKKSELTAATAFNCTVAFFKIDKEADTL
jgi:hypothetical protein